MDSTVIRDAFLKRSPEGSATRVLDEAVLEEFDKHGLGQHPSFLTMLETTATAVEHHSEWKRAKNAAYSLLGKARADAQRQESALASC